MAVLAILLGLLLLFGLGAVEGRSNRKERIRRDLRRADQRLELAHREARKEMNRVSGQSWRNTFE